MLKKFNSYKNRDTGFTLIELLVVVLIIGILAAIAVPIYLNVQNGSKKSTLQSDVATTRLSVAAALTQEKKLHDGTTSAAVGAKVSNSGAVSDEIVTVDVDTDSDGDFTVKAESASLNYSYTYSSLTKQSTPGTAAAVNAGGGGGTNGSDAGHASTTSYSDTTSNFSFNSATTGATLLTGTTGNQVSADANSYSSFNGAWFSQDNDNPLSVAGIPSIDGMATYNGGTGNGIKQIGGGPVKAYDKNGNLLGLSFSDCSGYAVYLTPADVSLLGEDNTWMDKNTLSLSLACRANYSTATQADATALGDGGYLEWVDNSNHTNRVKVTGDMNYVADPFTNVAVNSNVANTPLVSERDDAYNGWIYDRWNTVNYNTFAGFNYLGTSANDKTTSNIPAFDGVSYSNQNSKAIFSSQDGSNNGNFNDVKFYDKNGNDITNVADTLDNGGQGCYAQVQVLPQGGHYFAFATVACDFGNQTYNAAYPQFLDSLEGGSIEFGNGTAGSDYRYPLTTNWTQG